MLPIGVVVPSRNSMSLLPDHLAAMREWLPQVQEVVAVDSFSSDGTFERLQAELNHPRLRILQHPPGLYQSWNYGVQQVQAEYCYISTVGETITLEGLEHLTEVMRSLRCDVLVSRPRFVDLQGRLLRRPPAWPVQDILSSLRVREPIVLEGAALFFFTLLHYGNAFLGSSASNLYRTRCLQENPFPVDYGTAGDGGWGLEHCCEIRLGITPRTFSTFREHPKSYSLGEYAVNRLVRKFFDRACQTFREEADRNTNFASLARQLQVEQIIGLLEGQVHWQEQLEQCRRRALPWVLNPAAWSARCRRDGKSRAIARLKQAGLALLFPHKDSGRSSR
jgi:hypothetical protein